MKLNERARRGFAQGGDAAGLRTGLVLCEYPAGGEIQREVCARLLGRRSVLHRHKSGSAVRGGKPLGEEPWRARVVVLGTGPENAIVRVDPLPGHAAVVGRSPAEASRSSSNTARGSGS